MTSVVAQPDPIRLASPMAEPSLYRTFTPDFVTHMDRRGGWPDLTAIQNWLRRHHRPNKRDYLSRLRHGKYVPHKYATFYIEMLIAAGAERHFVQGHRALGDFVRERGFETLSLQQLDAIESHCCTPILSSIPDGADDDDSWVDWIIAGLGSLSQFPLDIFFRRLMSHCSAGAADKVALWTYMAVARERFLQGPSLHPEQAKVVSAPIVGAEFRDYEDRIRRWAETNPWTVLFAKRNRQVMGASIILPVYQQVYDEILAGERLTCEVTGPEIAAPSNWLVFESLCENPEALKAGRNPTRSMLHALAVQHGALMRLGYPGLSRKYHFLAPEGTPANRARMAASGFRSTSTTLSNGATLWERVIDFESGIGISPFDEVAMARLAKLCPFAPPIEASDQE